MRYWIGGLMAALVMVTATAPTSVMAAVKLAVAADGSAAYSTLKAALDALPAEGGDVTLAPGTYREKLLIDKPNVRLFGRGKRPQDVVLVWGDSNKMAGGTGKSASITITADNFVAHNLTIANDYSKSGGEPSQAVALFVTGDRAVFDTVRFLGAQDTLYAASKCRPNGSPLCHDSRQYFRNCYMEGHVDFIFGDARAYFDRCHIHAVANPGGGVMITAHSRLKPEQKSAYVFDHCTITADPGDYEIWLGRAWRPYATVIWLDTDIRAPLQLQGWREWGPATETFKTAYYAERGSRGPGAGRPEQRAPVTRQLTADQAKEWSKQALLSSPDGWEPWKMRF